MPEPLLAWQELKADSVSSSTRRVQRILGLDAQAPQWREALDMHIRILLYRSRQDFVRSRTDLDLVTCSPGMLLA